MRASKITAVDFFDDLTSPYARRRFVFLFSALLLLSLFTIFLSHYLISSQDVRDVLVGISINVASTCLATIIFYLGYVFFIGENDAQRAVAAVRPADIGSRMETLAGSTRSYELWGRSGSYFRARTIFALDKQAKDEKRPIQVRLLLPNPTDDRLIHSYRNILQALDEDQGDNPLLPNVLATCFVCAVTAARNKHLQIEVHLSRFLPAFRIDFSDEGALLTQDDPKKSALLFEYRSEFYDMLAVTMANERSVSTRVIWDAALYRELRLDKASCTSASLVSLGIVAHVDDQLREQVAKLVATRPHRYK